jgi:LytS/YehU family sensor histidine kinase
MEFVLQQIKVSVSHYPAMAFKDNLADMMFTAILFVVVALITTFSDFIGRWKAGIEEQARIGQLLLKSQYESLKNQVNPHFLFNALNTLTYLIREDEDNAVDFVQQLSKILRYSLEQQENTTDTIQNELKIARAYLFLFKQRFRHKLDFNISIPDSILQRRIVCHSLTMLLENAIKHNEISTGKPLLINIYLADEYLAVENNLQPKLTPEPSTGIGLANIRDRYKMVTELPVLTEGADEKWLVKIPVI